MLLPEPDHGVGQEQEQNNEKIRPVPDDPGEDDRDLDHPRNGAPEIAEEFQQRVLLLFNKFIRAVFGQPFFRLGLGEAVRRGFQPLLHLRQRQRLQIILRIRGVRLCPRLRDGRLRLVGLRFHNHVSFGLVSPQAIDGCSL